MVENLEQSFEWYKANLDKLAKEYSEKFIAIKGCKVIGSYDTMLDAIANTEKKGIARGTYIVQKASTDPSAYTMTYYNNLILAGR